MRLKIGGQDFDLDPLAGEKKLDDLELFAVHKYGSWSPVYKYDCHTDTATDADGKIKIELEPSAIFAVVKRRKKKGVTLDEPASKKMRDALVAKAGISAGDIVQGLKKHLGRMVVKADMTPALTEYRHKYSFEVLFYPAYHLHLLRLTGAHDVGHLLVAIPAEHAFLARKTGTCKGAHLYDGPIIKWIDPSEQNATWDAAFKSYYARMKEIAKDQKRRMKAEAKKRGIKINSRKEGE